MNSKLRIGIVGCGLIGKKRAKVVAEDSSCTLCCTADKDIQKSKALIEEYADGKGNAYGDWRVMLENEKLDVIIAATTNNYLKEITLEAARRKVHILCEKPLGRNAQESREMVTAGKENGIILKTGFNHLHHPAIAQAKKLAAEGVIGELYYTKCNYGHGGRPGYEKEWRACREVCGGGELLDQGVHVVNLFRWFFGDFQEVLGIISTYYWNMDVEDNAFALFKTAKGQIASMHTSWTQWKNRFTFEIFGGAGYLIVDGLGGSYGTEILRIGKRILVNRYSLSVHSRENNPNLSNQQITNNVLPYYGGDVPDEDVIEFPGPDISWQEEWKEFIAAIREKREPLGNGDDGLEANRMIEAVYRSAKENRPVKMSEV